MILKMARSYAKTRLFKKPSPISILLSVTNQCPKGCCYCDSWKHEPAYMPTDKIFKLLKELKQAGVSRITLNGGDPLMHPDFGKIVREIKKHKFYLTVSERETLVKKHIDDLKYVDLLFLSFDGTEKSHDKHKGKGSFADLIPTFEILNKNKINYQTTTVLTKINKGDIGFIIETAKKYNFKTHFQPLQLTPFKEIDSETFSDPQKNPLNPLILSKEEHRLIGEELLKFKKENDIIVTSEKILKLIFLNWPDPSLTYLPYKLNKSIQCWAGLLYLNIEVDGSMFPCLYYNPSYHNDDLPNVFTDGFKNALGKIKLNDKCQTCLIPCYMELNSMFSLDIKTILNWLPMVLKKI